jgi:hypothetical protein
MSSVTKLPNKLTSEFSKLFAKNKHSLEVVLVTLILLDIMPKKLMGTNNVVYNRAVKPVVNMVKNIVEHPLFLSFLFVVACYSYYYLHDMNMFFILLFTLMSTKSIEGYKDRERY